MTRSAPTRCSSELKRPELEDIKLKNRTTTAKLVWQPRGYDPHLHKWLHRIDVPTLLIWGANDRLFPKDYASAWQRLIPGSKAVIIPGVRASAADRAAAGFRRRARRLPRQQEGRGMKFFNFHLMPYRHADLDAIEKQRHPPGSPTPTATTIRRRAPTSITSISTRWSSPTGSASTASASTSTTRPPTA